MQDPEDCCQSKTVSPNAGPADRGPAQPCCAQAAEEKPGFACYPFVIGWLDTAAGPVPQVSSGLDSRDRLGRWAMRWGIGRSRYQITPGLYAVGQPDHLSPVLVSANYKLSFDCLRSAIAGLSAWVLVIDTKGVNVWCAAGKGTFGTAEIIFRCHNSHLDKVVRHKRLIVPQLGAPGVAAHKVRQDTGFSVTYGPVRAADIPEFIAGGMQATAAMRRVSFTTRERLILTPVEITGMRKPVLYMAVALLLLGGIGDNIFSINAAWSRAPGAIFAGLAGVLSGAVIMPILLPWLPGRLFSAKGALLGIIMSTVLCLTLYRGMTFPGLVALYLFVSSVSSYTAMNFTGSSTFTSPSGVEKEMRRSIPLQVGALLTAGALWLTTAF
ncbi:MAG: mercury methylation corrinoid protein HgcA [Desulfuromonadales bacterium]|nr:mercury methylation corrinoid protein HgcA [Desulfuromonadales bacterium]